ncbi:MAG: hypothetical protein V1790_16235 [Planctomycetota bacterium]
MSSTHKSFDSISFFKFSRNILSFSVSFTLHHHDLLAFLNDPHATLVGEEYDRDKPPHAVKPVIRSQGGNLIEVPPEWPEIGPHMRLVGLEIESRARLDLEGDGSTDYQCVQCTKQAGMIGQVQRARRDCRGSACCEQLTDTVQALCRPLAMLLHLLAEVLDIEHQSVEYEP